MAPTSLFRPNALNSNPEMSLPKFVYGTAWKKDRSAKLVYQAIKSGFRAIDTAAQPRHYNEAGVAEGIRQAISEGIVKRKDLYIQTKFTPPSGQDPNNMPYDASMALRDQIQTSIASSLKNFTFSGSEAPYLDALVLHSPLSTVELTQDAWRVFETYVPSQIRILGISNTTLHVLQSLHADMSIPPAVVQNRFYPDTRWEVSLRKFCRESDIVFQSFWTLTGNPALLKSKVVDEVVREVGCEREEALYALVVGLEGISVLNGTTREERMGRDLKSLQDLAGLVEGEMKGKWETWMKEFRTMIGETDS